MQLNIDANRISRIKNPHRVKANRVPSINLNFKCEWPRRQQNKKIQTHNNIWQAHASRRRTLEQRKAPSSKIHYIRTKKLNGKLYSLSRCTEPQKKLSCLNGEEKTNSRRAKCLDYATFAQNEEVNVHQLNNFLLPFFFSI